MHRLSFGVKDNEGLWSSLVEISFRITTPDLKVTAVELSTDDITDGDKVTITATVENNGDADASDITVTFYDGDKEIGEKTINSLETNSSTDITLSWEPDMGDHSLRVEVDISDEDITDGNTEDNTLSLSTNVKRNWTPWIIMIIIISIIITILAFMFARSMKEKKEKNKVISDMEAELEKARELGLPTAKLERMLKETKELGKAEQAKTKPDKTEKKVDEDIEEDEMLEEPNVPRKKKHK
jgi:hypothetical protein